MNDGPDPNEPVDDASGGAGESPPEFVLYPIFESHDKQSFEIARDIAEGAGMSLLVVDVLQSKSEIIDESRKVAASMLESKLDENHDIDIKTRYEETDAPVEAVIEAAKDHDTKLVVFDEHTPESLVTPITAEVPDRVREAVHCDVVTIKHNERNRIASILVGVAGGPHSSLSVAVAGAIARSVDAVLELFYVSETDEDEGTAQSHFDTAREQLPPDVESETCHLLRDDVVDAIVEQSGQYDMTVIGEPERGRLRRFAFGSVTDEVSDKATNTVLVSRRSARNSFTVR